MRTHYFGFMVAEYEHLMAHGIIAGSEGALMHSSWNATHKLFEQVFVIRVVCLIHGDVCLRPIVA